MTKSPVTASLPSPVRATRVDLKESVGNFSTSKKSALFRCPSRWASQVLTEAASIEASTYTSDGRELPFHIGNHHVLDFELGHGVYRINVPDGGLRCGHGTHAGCPLTLLDSSDR